MKSTISELYYGNINLYDHELTRGSGHEKVLRQLTKHEDILTATLTEAQKELLEKVKDGTAELNSLDELSAFTLGFKLGLRITSEAFINDITDPQKE